MSDPKAMSFARWISILFSGKPHFMIGEPERPYLLRWYLLPRNRHFNLFLHKFLQDDDRRALHDHPWPFISLILRGSYLEVVRDERRAEKFGLWRCATCGNDQPPELDSCANCGREKTVAILRRQFSIAFRPAEHRHRVELLRVPTWTLILTGQKIRTWGFWCEGKRFVPWQEFTKPNNPGEIGRGCE